MEQSKNQLLKISRERKIPQKEELFDEQCRNPDGMASG